MKPPLGARSPAHRIALRGVNREKLRVPPLPAALPIPNHDIAPDAGIRDGARRCGLHVLLFLLGLFMRVDTSATTKGGATISARKKTARPTADSSEKSCFRVSSS